MSQDTSILSPSQGENVQPNDPIKPFFYPRYVNKENATSPGLAMQQQVVYALYQLKLGRDPFDILALFFGFKSTHWWLELEKFIWYVKEEVERVLGPDAMTHERFQDAKDFCRERECERLPLDADLFLREVGIIDDAEYQRRCEKREEMRLDPAEYLPLFLADGFTAQEAKDVFRRLQFETTASKEVIEKLYHRR